MGKGNAAVKQWMSNKARFADLFNGIIFRGEQVELLPRFGTMSPHSGPW